MPTFFGDVAMFMLEIHFVTNADASAAQRHSEIEAFGRVATSLQNHRVYKHSVNPDTSQKRFHDPSYYGSELYNAGTIHTYLPLPPPSCG
jgi:hypothetical protein